MSAAVVSEPLNALEPLQPPDAVHDETLEAVQLSVVVPPGATPGGDAVSDTAADVAFEMLTVVRVTAAPPGPLQLSVNVVLAVSAALRALPFTGWVPRQPPDAVQVSALLVVHDNVAVPPDATLVGLADKLIVGGLWPPADELPEPEPPPPHAVRTITMEETANVRAACIDFNKEA